jgi:hypothetical protein
MTSTRGSRRSIKDTEVRVGTGQGWDGWITLLDGINAKDKSLKEIIDHLEQSHRLEQVWAQVIAVYYKWGI